MRLVMAGTQKRTVRAYEDEPWPEFRTMQVHESDEEPILYAYEGETLYEVYARDIVGFKR